VHGLRASPARAQTSENSLIMVRGSNGTFYCTVSLREVRRPTIPHMLLTLIRPRAQHDYARPMTLLSRNLQRPLDCRKL
jgi:hypothetical protein